ncbi:hypothetical protein V8G54_024802 [Vigna mungo]|uniref:Uncharacterized protein n=1 Tax=Vigna mungo TaxID=3915 RepID=A0AAQ3N7V3_VIGMU
MIYLYNHLLSESIRSTNKTDSAPIPQPFAQQKSRAYQRCPFVEPAVKNWKTRREGEKSYSHKKSKNVAPPPSSLAEGILSRQLADSALYLYSQTTFISWHFSYAFDKGRLRTQLQESLGENMGLKLKLQEAITAHSSCAIDYDGHSRGDTFGGRGSPIERQLKKLSTTNTNLQEASRRRTVERDASDAQSQDMNRVIYEEHSRGFEKALHQVPFVMNVSIEEVPFYMMKDLYKGDLVPIREIPHEEMVKVGEVGVVEEVLNVEFVGNFLPTDCQTLTIDTDLTTKLSSRCSLGTFLVAQLEVIVHLKCSPNLSRHQEFTWNVPRCSATRVHLVHMAATSLRSGKMFNIEAQVFNVPPKGRFNILECRLHILLWSLFMTYCALVVDKHFSRGVEKPLLYKSLPIRTDRVILFKLVMLTFSPSSCFFSRSHISSLQYFSVRSASTEFTSIVGFVKASLMIDESCVFSFPLANLDKA